MNLCLENDAMNKQEGDFHLDYVGIDVRREGVGCHRAG